MTATTARIVVGAFDATIFAPFQFKEVVKAFPGRRWDSERKCWLLDVAFTDDVADALRRAGCTVYLTRQDGTAWKSGRPDHGHRDEPADGWAEMLFAAVGPERADSIFRALSKVLHPDVSGDDGVLMRELLEARNGGARRSA
jgi:hypothetical protein